MQKIAQRFVLERQIGSGGMARVYLGRDEVLHRPVAVKVLEGRHASTEIAERFRREGRTAARLSHPNIVQVYDAGEADFDGRVASYIVMEYLPGGDLKALVDREGPLPSGKLAALGAAVASGLEHAHEHGVVHRDIKPHNVLLDAAGRPKLSDFGIARALDATQATRSGAYLGTALYSAPEQLRGRGVTPKSDVYSLGVTLYQALTGDVPFAGTPIEVASQHISAAPPPPSSFRSGLNAGLEEIILDCLEKDPDRRPSAREVSDRLAEVAAREARPSPPAPEPRPRTDRSAPAGPAPQPKAVKSRSAPHPAGRKKRGLALLAGLAALVVLLGGAVVLSSNGLWVPAQNSSDGGSAQDQQGSSGQAAQRQQAPGGGGDASDSQPGVRDQASEQPAPRVEASRVQAGEQGGAGGSGSDAASEDAGGDNGGGGGEPAPSDSGASSGAGSDQASEQSSTAEQDNASASASSGAEVGDPLSVEAAEQTVVDHYNVAASDNYPEAWNFLSSRYQAEIGSQAAYTNQFSTLERIQFTSGPTAEVNGDTATVSFSTIAYHTNRTDRRTGTATLVQEGGEWKIDLLSFY